MVTQENRARAKEEVNNILNRNYEKAAQRILKLEKLKSRQLYLQITEFRKILLKISMNWSYSRQNWIMPYWRRKTELTNAGISKEIIIVSL